VPPPPPPTCLSVLYSSNYLVVGKGSRIKRNRDRRFSKNQKTRRRMYPEPPPVSVADFGLNFALPSISKILKGLEVHEPLWTFTSKIVKANFEMTKENMWTHLDISQSLNVELHIYRVQQLIKKSYLTCRVQLIYQLSPPPRVPIFHCVGPMRANLLTF
jgi:hypothetical protein